MAAASFKLFGVSEAAARLPSALCALFATLALAWLAWRVYGEETARWLLLLLPTSVGMIGFSHAAATDMPFSGMLTIAMVCAAVALGLTRNENTPVLPRTPWLALLLFGFFLGLAVLAKGPAAIILSGGAVFFWALTTKRWRDAFHLLHPVAIVSFCATALPWYILCARRNPDFFRVFIIEHNFKRYLTPEFQHIQPFWYYAPVVLAMFFPWLAILVSGIKRIARGSRALLFDSLTLLLLTFPVFCVVFFSVSRSKLPGYVLPAAPFIGLLLAKHWAGELARKNSGARWLGVAVGLTLLAFSILLGYFHSHIPVMTDIEPPPLISQLILFAFLGGMATLVLALARRPSPALSVCGVTILVLLTVGSSQLWELDEGLSSRRAAQIVGELGMNNQSLEAVTFNLRRDHVYSLQFYLRKQLPEWSPGDANTKLVFTNYKGAQELERKGVECLHGIVFPPVILCGAPVMNKVREQRDRELADRPTGRQLR
jgi:4-amino-4-deoxy-L-arabinose transferase-like glycosyltransferase